MTNFPMILFLTVVSTNWIGNNDWMRVGGTNYAGQRQVITTNLYAVEVTLCTNKTLIHQTTNDTTNSPTRWQVVTPPPLPGRIEKE